MVSIGDIIRGDWPARLLCRGTTLIALVALLGIAMVLTLNPYLLLGYGAIQVILVVGVILFIIVAMLSQRAMVLEEFFAEQIIFKEGDPGRHMYVIKSGTVEVVVKRADGSDRGDRPSGAGRSFWRRGAAAPQPALWLDGQNVNAGAHLQAEPNRLRAALRQLAGATRVPQAERRTASAPARGDKEARVTPPARYRGHQATATHEVPIARPNRRGQRHVRNVRAIRLQKSRS